MDRGAGAATRGFAIGALLAVSGNLLPAQSERSKEIATFRLGELASAGRDVRVVVYEVGPTRAIVVVRGLKPFVVDLAASRRLEFVIPENDTPLDWNLEPSLVGDTLFLISSADRKVLLLSADRRWLRSEPLPNVRTAEGMPREVSFLRRVPRGVYLAQVMGSTSGPDTSAGVRWTLGAIEAKTGVIRNTEVLSAGNGVRRIRVGTKRHLSTFGETFVPFSSEPLLRYASDGTAMLVRRSPLAMDCCGNVFVQVFSRTTGPAIRVATLAAARVPPTLWNAALDAGAESLAERLNVPFSEARVALSRDLEHGDRFATPIDALVASADDLLLQLEILANGTSRWTRTGRNKCSLSFDATEKPVAFSGGHIWTIREAGAFRVLTVAALLKQCR